MEINALWTLASGGLAACAKPAFDYLSGRTTRKREAEQQFLERIERLEKANDELRDKLEATRLESAERKESLNDQIDALRGDLADLQADRDQLAADLQITADHVATLQEQLKGLGQEPRPRPPTPPRDAGGRFTKHRKRKT